MRRAAPVRALLTAALAATGGAARGSGFVAPALDSTGTFRLDGGAPAPEDGAAVTIFGGAGTTEVAGLDRIMGIGALMRPAPGLELGLGLPDFRQHPDGMGEPVVDPGFLLFEARTATIPQIPGLAFSLLVTAPVAPIEGISDPAAFEPRVAFGHSFGPFRPMGNAAMAFDVGGGRVPWGGVGLRIDPILWGSHARFDVSAPVGGDWRAGGGLGFPLGAGVDLFADAWRRDRLGGTPEYEALVGLSLEAGADGVGAPFRIDRDHDGIANADDACPRVAGDGPDGCPTPEFGILRCGCPLDDLAPFEVERLIASMMVPPQGKVYVIEVRIRPVGDAAANYEATREVVEATREALLGEGVPKRNFVVVGRPPLTIAGAPLLTIRLVPVWKAPSYIDAAELKKPEG